MTQPTANFGAYAKGDYTIAKPDDFTTWGWQVTLAAGEKQQFCRYGGPARSVQWQVQLVNATNAQSVTVEVQAGMGRGSFTNTQTGVRHYQSGTVFAESVTLNVTNTSAAPVTVFACLVPADAVQLNPANVATYVAAAASSTTTVPARARAYAIVSCTGTGPIAVSLTAAGQPAYTIAANASVRIDNWQGAIIVVAPASTTGHVTEVF